MKTLKKSQYELIAEVIRETKLLSQTSKHDLAIEFSDILQAQFHNFDLHKFLQACGVEVWCEICSNEYATQTVNGEQVCSMCAKLGHIR